MTPFVALLLAMGARCHAGALPDATCSPGAVDPSVTLAVVCHESTKARRHVSESTRRYVLAEYGIAWADRGAFEVDHRVPIDVGGSNDLTNLWPEPIADAHVKDKAEARARLRVCSGRETLAAVQARFLGDWTK